MGKEGVSMDEKSLEVVLKKIIDIDKKTDDEVKRVRIEIVEREKQLKSIISEIEQNSNLHQTQHGKKLFERIMAEAEVEQNKIHSDCDEKLAAMDRLFEANKTQMLEKAFQKLAVDKWGT